jgi:hypothetical protein
MNKKKEEKGEMYKKKEKRRNIRGSVADLDHFDTDPDPAFHPDPTFTFI